MKTRECLRGAVACCLLATVASGAIARNGDDPLYSYQWHLKNAGQAVFADRRPWPGIDLRMGTLHERGIRGKGVVVAVIDSGVDGEHEDLKANLVPGGSMDYEDGSRTTRDVSGHGTAVAGIIAASGWNGVGGRGVAPEASLKSLNAYEVVDFGDLVSEKVTFRHYFGLAWGGSEEARDVDVFNNSVGLRPLGRYRTVARAEIANWEQLMRSTRGGLGGIYVWAAGNDFQQPPIPDQEEATASGLNFDQNAGCPANRLGLTCSLADFDFPATFVPTITVASVNAQGRRSYFSSPGASLWVSAPGGEDGLQADIVGAGRRWNAYGPGVLTTDIAGCEEGFNMTAEKMNRLDGGTAVDPNCNYSAAFAGTSSAAPMVSGVAALMLGVNPYLTQRDVKYILARTARIVDPQQPRIVLDGVLVERGWVTNAAGYRFSNWYGFGLVDASAAVTMARGFRTLPAQVESGWLVADDEPVRIRGRHAPATKRIRVMQDIRIEATQFSLGTSHGRPSQLLVTLTSPSGTVSHVLTPYTNLVDQEDFTIPLSSSNAFFGESSRGVWTLSVTDLGGQLSDARLRTFGLRVVGHRADAPRQHGISARE